METTPAAAVGAAVRGAMDAARRTPQWMAENSGIERSRIDELLLGASDISFAELYAIAQALGLPAHDLTPPTESGSDELPTIVLP